MANYDDLPGFSPPPKRPSSELAVEPERVASTEDPAAIPAESIAFRVRQVARRAAGSSTAVLLVAAVLVGGAVAVTRASDVPPRPEPPPAHADPAPRPPAVPEVPVAADAPRSDEAARNGLGRRHESDERRFRFHATAGGTASAPSSGTGAPAPAPTPDRARAPDPKQSPKPSPTPYTPTKILIRLTHPNGAYFFTTDQSAAIRKEGYDGYTSERAAVVWAERRGPAMIRLELSDDSVGFIYSRESDVRTGDPAPLYAASTRRYGRFYSLDRDQAAAVGPVVVYGWVATY